MYPVVTADSQTVVLHNILHEMVEKIGQRLVFRRNFSRYVYETQLKRLKGVAPTET
jgi:hypothetical protein